MDLSDPWGRALLQLFGGGKIGRQGVGVGYWLLKYDLIPITKSLYSISFFSGELTNTDDFNPNPFLSCAKTSPTIKFFQKVIGLRSA